MSTSGTKNAAIVGFIASLGCILALVVDSTSLNAASNPPGGYQQSCRDIAADGTSVVAECMNFNGDWTAQTKLNYTGCGGEIYNYDGQLKCAGLPPPQGTYQSTCNELRTDSDQVLHARCATINGGWITTSLAIVGCQGNIANIDGTLHCNRSPVPIPSGSYLETCWDVAADGIHLSATCRTLSGDSAGTSAIADYPACARSNQDISNRDGVLTCASITPANSPCSWGNPNHDPHCGASVNPNPTPPWPPGSSTSYPFSLKRNVPLNP
ncbi:CVNH domain-containing protein [Rhizobium sp.]|uniref:CVNH domain-containing protein n=1 Tax=Rhizobium sp. TaxID=391 RepID=UPI002EE0455F